MASVMVFMGTTMDGAHRGEQKSPGAPGSPHNTAPAPGSAGAPDSSAAKDGTRNALSALVLIVEDEEPIALALAYIVEDAGYTPLVAMHGQQALELARSQHPALILTDLMMPQMSGQDFYRELTRRSPDAAARIVFVTG
ncbi:MAG: response regulator, partial [Ktedonobacterales bacterium]